MQTKIAQLVLFWFGIIMAALFLAGGFIFLATNILIDNLPKPNRTYFAIILIVYGAFRAARQYTQYQKMKREND